MRRHDSTWIGIRVDGDDLETVIHHLLGRFHGLHPPEFVVYNAWSLASEQNEFYLSPVAFDSLEGMRQRPAPYRVIGPIEVLPPHCDMLMGDQSGRAGHCIDLPAFFHPHPDAQKRRPS